MTINNIDTEIQAVFDGVILSLNNIDDNILNEIPFEHSWTIGQVADHIVLCSKSILDDQIAETDRPYDENVAELKNIFLNMEQKTEAAPRVYPGLPPHNKSALIKHLEKNKTNLLKMTAEKDLTALSLDIEFPFMGYFTRYEWLVFICVHTRRHLNQINNIKRRLNTSADVL
ncbi:MAG: DinB family protein [Agriterribacter sp.]